MASRRGRRLYEVPVGFKWYASGLYDGSVAFAGEESGGGTMARFDGSVWTTDKDGIALALLSAEMTARSGRDPGQIYQGLIDEFGEIAADRIDAPATVQQKSCLAKPTATAVPCTSLRVRGLIAYSIMHPATVRL